MEEKEIVKYFERYVGTDEDVRQGKLSCYGEDYMIHPKFAPGIYDIYRRYKRWLSDLQVENSQIRAADQVYTTKGDGFGNVSWGIETYKNVAFQAVFVCRKFSLRVYHVLNMLTHAYERGFLRGVEHVGGYGSGPCMELYIAQSFFREIGQTVKIHAYDPVDWQQVGALKNADFEGEYDLLITSFVLNNYVHMKDLPAHKEHIALEGKTFSIPTYQLLNTASLMEHDKFSMWFNRNVILGRATILPRPVGYVSNSPFVHYFADFTAKDKQVHALLSYASGTVLDVGAGSYDIRRLTKCKVIRQDIVPRDSNTVCEYVPADYVLFNMSIHHMDIPSIWKAVASARRGVLIRDVDVTEATIDYEDAVHYLYDMDPEVCCFVKSSYVKEWFRRAGWIPEYEAHEGSKFMIAFKKQRPVDQLQFLSRCINDRTRDLLPDTIRALRAKHYSMCRGSLRPFRTMQEWAESITFCRECSARLKPYPMRTRNLAEHREGEEIQEQLVEHVEVTRQLIKKKRGRRRKKRKKRK